MKQIDILTIGDIAIDAFIKINEAEALCDLEGEHCKLCLNYGGKIPYESAEICYAVGNSSNVAVCASRLGLKTALMANIGGDQNGNMCLTVLKKENIDLTLIKKESDLPTNFHYVLWYGKERTILVKHEKYNYNGTNVIELQDHITPTWIYLSSLGKDSLDFHNEILEYLKKHTEIKLAFQPGTFQIKLGIDKLIDIYKRTDVLFCNHMEAEKLLKIEPENISTDKDGIIRLIKMLYDYGPRIVVITDGINGSYSYDGSEILYMKAYYQDTIESTGAGDAFSGSFISALTQGKNISEALMWGAANASFVVLDVGPQKGLLTRKQIEEKVKIMEVDYKPIIIN
jgi:sugar/nucleoside kinase (ribokinase family)